MRVIGRTSTGAGFSIHRKNGGIHPLSSSTNTTSKGNGLAKEFYEKTEVRHPFQSLGKTNQRNTLESIKIKSSNPKKYISFNM
jgi:hypothetical protein